LTEVIKTSLIFFQPKKYKTVFISVFYSYKLFLAHILLPPNIRYITVVPHDAGKGF